MRLLNWISATVFALTVTTGASAAEPKTLRIALPASPTTFDPAQAEDVYSHVVIAAIFEAPLENEYLAQPLRSRPDTASAMPDVSEDFRTFTVRIRPGIFFADDPAFGGVPRELVAGDYVYSIKRYFDPRWRSPKIALFEPWGIIGLAELRQQAMDGPEAFDYDREVPGLRTLDRYTFQIVLERPDPGLVAKLASGAMVGAIAREVVEHYGDRIGEHPVGTGPFRLTRWTRGSRIRLDRNPDYRTLSYTEEAAVDDPERQATARRLAGRRLPLVDRIDMAIIEEAQPRWLAFLSGDLDLLTLPPQFADLAAPNGALALAPYLAKRGIGLHRYVTSSSSMTQFAMEHPLVGGYEPHQVALRRAISMAVDVEREILVARRQQAIPAQGLVPPGAWGYDPAFKSEMSDYDLPRAKALLDLYGYMDADGDGWRDQRDGRPLVLEYATQPDQASRSFDALWKKNMDALGLRLVFRTASWPENLKASRAGQLMLWTSSWNPGEADPLASLILGYGPQRGLNHARFNLPEYDRLLEAGMSLPDGPERRELVDRAVRLLIAYMPYKIHVHGISTQLTQPWLTGYHGAALMGPFLEYVDVDASARDEAVSGKR
jgi:ABC-type transport system substrate-binding protein